MLVMRLHFGNDRQTFYCAYSCNPVFSEARLFSLILHEIRNCWASELHAQFEVSLLTLNVFVGLLVTTYCVFELIQETEWKERFIFSTKTTGLPSQVSSKYSGLLLISGKLSDAEKT